MAGHLAPDVLARIDALELAARQVVEGYLAGRHRSPRHGFAVEFAQHREYAPGDDTRHIDWKVYARTERYHLKQYEQETNLVAWLLVDASGSMAVGPKGRTKYDAACTLAAALAHLVVGQADSLGFQHYAATPRGGGRPSGGPSRVREFVRACAQGPFAEPADTGAALKAMAGQTGRRGIVFLFSDLLDDVEPFREGVRALKSRKHEVVVFQVLDAAELDFPFRQPTLFKGLEDFAELSTDPLSIRESYLAGLHKHLEEIETACRVAGADYVRVRTDDDLGRVLAGYLQKRSGR